MTFSGTYRHVLPHPGSGAKVELAVTVNADPASACTGRAVALESAVPDVFSDVLVDASCWVVVVAAPSSLLVLNAKAPKPMPQI